MVTKAILSACYFRLTQPKFDSAFVTVAQVSDNVTHYHLLVFFCLICFFFLDVYNFVAGVIVTVFCKWVLQPNAQETQNRAGRETNELKNAGGYDLLYHPALCAV